MEQTPVNYDDSLVSLANSIMKYFEIQTKHKTMSDIDKILEEDNPKNVVVILYDGMGYNLINRLLPEDSFIRTHMLRSFSSVVPATTTAATTSMITGMYPSEHGWLGWNLYIPPFKKIVTMYLNVLKDTEEQAAEYNVSEKYYPYKNISDQINEAGKYTSKIIFPFGNYLVYQNIEDMKNKIIEECNKDGKKYIYVYYEQPDSMMHELGTNAQITKDMFRIIDMKTKEISDGLDDTVLIVTADHGHKDVINLTLTDYPDFFDTLDGDVWLEGRLCSFKVKDEKRFVELFNKYFGNDFILKTKEEVINEHLFGDGQEHQYFRDSLGDYLAIAISDKCFNYNDMSTKLASCHAGMCEDEMRIPLILRRKKI